MQPQHEFEKLILNNEAIQAMSKLYYASYFFDLPDDTFSELHADVLKVHSTIGEQGDLRETMRLMSEKLVRPEYKKMIAEFTDIDTLDERMKDREFITCEYEGAISGWSEAIFLVVDRLDNGNIHHALFLIRTISENKRKEYEQAQKLKDDLEFEKLAVMSIQQMLGSAFWSLRVDENHQVIDATFNDAFKLMLGMDLDAKPTFKDIYAAIHDDDKKHIFKALNEAIEDTTGNTVYDQEHRMKLVDGTYKWFRGAGKLCRREGIPGSTFFGVLVNMNDKVLAQQAFSQEQLRTQKQLEILFSAANIYLTMHVIDFETGELFDFSAVNKRQEIVGKPDAEHLMHAYISNAVEDEYKDKILSFIDFKNVQAELREKSIITEEVVCTRHGWVRVSFIIVNRDDEGKPKRALFTTQVIEEEKRREEELLHKSNTDKLTRFLNRTAYEEDLSAYAFLPPEDDFVFMSLDLNGLKDVNDTYGHVAGDELIVGAATCMRETIGNYGKLYRIGGDEFAAMIHADDEELSCIIDNFERAYKTWRGHYVDSVSISYGYAIRKEFEHAPIDELARKADERMYADKADYYRAKGVDRRGQTDAFNAICDSYTRISKIDLTNDRYQDVRSLDDLRDFSSLFSVSMKEVVQANLIAAEDVEYFEKHTDIDSLRRYFKRGNKSFCIRYRRRIDDDYRLVMMELIRTPEYTDDNQLVFMYVKDIDFM